MPISFERRTIVVSPSRAFGLRGHLHFVQLLAAFTLGAVPASVLAIGPSDQKIPDDPTPLSLRATGWFGTGTGTVVGTKLAGTTGYAAVLTARHVADNNPASIKLGSLIDGAQPWLEISMTGAFSSFIYRDATKNSKNLPADIALMLGKINNLTEGSPALAKFNLLSNNLPRIVDPTKDPGNPFLKATASKPVGFTQLGYGRQGAFHNDSIFLDGDITIKDRYEATGASGERLFQNNNAIGASPLAIRTNPITGDSKFYHPLVQFNAIGPPNNLGQGLGMGGDSGSPLFTMKPDQQVSVGVTRGGNAVQIPIDYTDSLSAIFVSSVSVTVTQILEGMSRTVPREPETVQPDSEQSAVPIDADIAMWLQPLLANPMLIPEPATTALLAGSGFLLTARSRRRRLPVS